jgi:hypothetical protein
MIGLNPLDTIFKENPDYNASDHQTEMELLCDRQKQIDNFLNGSISDDELLAVLEENQGFNIDKYLDEVEENLVFAESQLPFLSDFSHADFRIREQQQLGFSLYPFG